MTVPEIPARSPAPLAASSLPLQERRWYRTTVLTGLAVLVVAAGLLAVGWGTIDLTPGQVVSALVHTDDSWHRVVWDIRLPRMLLAALVGMNLATSGTILQAVMANPLADPSIIGISSGAGLVGIAILVIHPENQTLVPPLGFAGAMAAALTIYALAWRGGIQPLRIILAGVAVSALCGAGISAVMVLYSDRVQGALMFMNGSMSLRGWTELRMIWPYSLVALAITLMVDSRLNILVLGDDVAGSMGMNVQASRLFFTTLAALLAAVSVAAVGLLSFVGLIVPHIMRLVLGSDHRVLIPGSILCGAALLMLSDTLSRTLFSPVEIPVGIAMAALGVPFFLF
ncbi:FecCD family ABC transporter permease, partial [Acidipropionibacterium jensenii]